jgi:hypothetical protein
MTQTTAAARRTKQRVKLSAAPKTFEHTIEVEMLDGSLGSIGVTYQYRTRSEYAKLLDEIQARQEPEPPAPPADAPADGEAAPRPRVDMDGMIMRVQADLIGRICTDWDMDDVPFSAEAVRELCDQFPAVAARIIGDYGRALTEGRLGN